LGGREVYKEVVGVYSYIMVGIKRGSKGVRGGMYGGGSRSRE